MSAHGTLVGARYGVTRSAKWPAVERAHLARSHLLIGHFDDYESMNLHVRSEARGELHGMTAV